MGRNERLQLIKEIEQQRESRLLVTIWGDRPGQLLNPGLETVIAADAHPIVFEHLESWGEVNNIDVLMYSAGGHTLAAWGLANLYREYCSKVGVLIPHRALSAATLIALSADEIIMSRLGHLSPIDPSITSPLGPTLQVQPGQVRVVPISVEDVAGFFELAINSADIKKKEPLLSIFDRLASQVHPLALGGVYRSREQIQTLADRLLSFHMKGDRKKKERELIVSMLTRELGSHDYLIGRTEAKERMGLNVIDVSPDLNRKILDLFNEYQNLLSLRQPYNPEGFLGSQNILTGTFNRAIIESIDLTHVFRTIKTVQRIQIQQGGMPGPISVPGYQEMVSFEGWVNDQSI
ncbi:MAG: hypothetical protein WCD72_02630 [Dehalococcoidia bacterium]